MINNYSHCIFCFNPVTDADKKGRGEHIVPEYLYGSICIKDVCISCNSKLGGCADEPAIEDARLISAVFALDLPNLQNKIRERGSATIVDVTDHTVGTVKFKNGRKWAVPRPVGTNQLNTDEKDWGSHLSRMLSKKLPPGMTIEEVNQVIDGTLRREYDLLKPGESVSERRLGIRLRKAPGLVKPEFKVSKAACQRLVAKIGYEIAFLTFGIDRVAKLPVLQRLAEVAMGDGNLDESVLMYPPGDRKTKDSPTIAPGYYHRIDVRFEQSWNLIDIYLFGSVGFRLFLHSESQVACGPISLPDGDIDMIGLLMTFEPNKPKSKYLARRWRASGEIEEYEVTGFL